MGIEFTINKAVFLSGLQKTLGIADKRTTTPILNNILLVAEENKITIKATDLEISIVIEMEASIRSKGRITLLARKIFEMIREMQGMELSFRELEEHSVEMICGNAIYRIQGLSDEEFPSIDVRMDKNILSLNAQKFSEMIRKSVFSVSNEVVRRNISGVYLDMSIGNKIKMVGTDGNRLSLVSIEIYDLLDVPIKGLLIGKRGISELKKNIEGFAGEIAVGMRDKFVIVKAGNMMMQLNTIEAEYPDYRQVVALPEPKPLIVKRDDILGALRITRVVAEGNYSTGVTLNIANNKIKFTAVDQNIGEASDEIGVDYSGEAIDISYNVNFLIDAIDVIEGEEVVLDFGMEGKPIFIKEQGSEEYMAVIMPVRAL